MVETQDNPVLVKISSAKTRPSVWWRGPLADKFFLVGLLAGIYGITYLGVHLLLIRDGQMDPGGSYPTQRHMHAVIQIFLFFGSFIVGFILQALPKLLERPGTISPGNLLLLLPLCLGVMLAPFSSVGLLSAAFLCLTFLVVLGNVLRLMVDAPLKVWLGKGIFLVAALVSWCLAPFMDLGNPLNSLLILWVSILGVVFSSSKHFIAVVLGGRTESALFDPLSLLFFLCAACGLATYSWGAYETGWIIFAYSALLTLVFFVVGTGLIGSFFRAKPGAIYLALAFGFSWAVVGAVTALAGPHRADSVLHIWATGWASTLVLAVAPRMTGVLSGQEVISSRLLIAVLLIWQIVPLGRGFDYSLGTYTSWIVGSASSLAFIVWAIFLARGIWRSIKRQMSL